MNSPLDALLTWFQANGIHPVLGAFVLGIVVAIVLGAFRRRSVSPGPSADYGFLTSPPAGRTPRRPPGSVQPVPLDADEFASLRSGQKIDAIKRLRARTGLSLREALAAVEAAEEAPDGSRKPPT